MKEDFNEKIVQKIKEQLQSHEEDYQDGAWENFLAKRKEKKQRLLFWYLKDIAASIVIISVVGLLLIERQPNVKDSYIITEEKPTTSGDSLPKVDMIIQKPINNDEKESVIVDTEDINNRKNNENKDSVFKDILGNKKFINDTYPIVNNKVKKQNAYPNKKNAALNPTKEENDERDIAIISKNQINGSREMKTQKMDKGNKNESSVYIIKKSIVEFDLKPTAHLKMVVPTKNKKNELANNLEVFIEPVDENMKELNKSKIEIGLLLSPSYGQNTQDNNSISSSSMGAGLAINIPINNSNVSFSTGAVFNALNITNDRTIKTGEFSSAKETVNHDETSLYGIDIPLNLMYNISNSKIYVEAGVSSYITFNETMDLTSTFVREVEVFHLINDVVETYTSTESVTTKETSKSDGIQFHPLGTINLSIGYRASLSDKLIYEIQPFYKYPLSALTNQEGKIHTAGLTLKLIFSK